MPTSSFQCRRPRCPHPVQPLAVRSRGANDPLQRGDVCLIAHTPIPLAFYEARHENSVMADMDTMSAISRMRTRGAKLGAEYRPALLLNDDPVNPRVLPLTTLKGARYDDLDLETRTLVIEIAQEGKSTALRNGRPHVHVGAKEWDGKAGPQYMLLRNQIPVEVPTGGVGLFTSRAMPEGAYVEEEDIAWLEELVLEREQIHRRQLLEKHQRQRWTAYKLEGRENSLGDATCKYFQSTI